MRLEHLILIRLATLKSPSPAKLRDDLKPLMAVDDVQRVFDSAIRALVNGGLLTVRPYRLTERGRARAVETLGVGDKFPPWRRIKSHHLPALALGVPVAAAEDLEAAVVAQVLIRALGLTLQGSDPRAVFRSVVATALRARNDDLDDLAGFLARRWVAEEATAKPQEKGPWTADDVVAAVRNATSHVPAAGRFGGDRVFVSAIWRQLGEGSAFAGLTLDKLKAILLAANRQQQLTLARADLVGAMDPREVAASEIRHLNSTFHFVLDRARR